MPFEVFLLIISGKMTGFQLEWEEKAVFHTFEPRQGDVMHRKKPETREIQMENVITD